ncbi:MAG: FtsW/RodA/SpoVE family cell cycle protein [Lachnospiraceae bacterium]
MFKRYKIKNYDFGLIFLLIAISIIGILSVGSAEASLQNKQIIGLILGLFLMVVLSLFDYSFFLNFYWLFYIANIILLLGVKYFGINVGGSTRWINILGIQFQPSEVTKIILILFYAQFIMKHKEQINKLKTLLILVLLLLPSLLLILDQPDLSTSILIVAMFAAIVFIGGLSYKIVAGILVVAIPAFAIIFTMILQPDQTLILDYQQTRILAWLHPFEYANAEGYQQANSITAIGSGQLFGKGLNNNVIGSVKNGNFIPKPETDFIFSIVGEELGFIGSCLVIILLILIALKCLMIAKQAKDLAGTLICTGMAAVVGFQSFLNIAVATGVLPNTGIPLPFVSYGLTSLVSMFIGMGFVLNIRLQSNKKY